MAVKSSNVTARVEPELKLKAESILSDLGIPTSTAINMYYRQIVLHNGLPFIPCIPSNHTVLEDMPAEEFNSRMTAGFSQAQSGNAKYADDVFSKLIKEVSDG